MNCSVRALVLELKPVNFGLQKGELLHRDLASYLQSEGELVQIGQTLVLIFDFEKVLFWEVNDCSFVDCEK